MITAFEPFSDFRATSAKVLEYLHQRLGFSLWMVTRTDGDDWIVLQSEDHGYDVKEGDVFKWSDSFCSRMVRGEGPCIAPKSNDIPAYLDAPIGRQVPIGAYVGLPLTKPDGELFGTLCAINPESQSSLLVQEMPQLELISRMLGTILGSELKAESEMRRAERAEEAAERDALTGMFNRRGWDRLVGLEECRCRRYGHQAYVLSIDLDGFKQINDTRGHSAGDQMLVKAARAIDVATRDADVVARVGGDEFAVLAMHCNLDSAEEIEQRLNESLIQAGIRGSIGAAKRDPHQTLTKAWMLADERMYENKRKRRENAPTANVTC